MPEMTLAPPRLPSHLSRTPQEEEIISACPLQAGPLHTTLRDLALSVEWHDLRVLELRGTGWAIILGHKRHHEPIRAVLPLPLHTTSLRPSSLKSIFSALEALHDTDIPDPLPPFAPSIEELKSMGKRKARPLPDDLNGQPVPPDVSGAGDGSASAGGTANQAEKVDTSLDRSMIYVSIVTADSTVVYYKLTRGIKKPADIPDE